MKPKPSHAAADTYFWGDTKSLAIQGHCRGKPHAMAWPYKMRQYSACNVRKGFGGKVLRLLAAKPMILSSNPGSQIHRCNRKRRKGGSNYAVEL
ncbi:hypothetical protein BgiMline_029617 [Biomphalaria glabrata]